MLPAWVCLFLEGRRQHAPEASSVQRSLWFPQHVPLGVEWLTVAASLHARRAALLPLGSHTASEQHRSRWRYLSTLATWWDLWALRDPDPLTRGASRLGRGQAWWKAPQVTPGVENAG